MLLRSGNPKSVEDVSFDLAFSPSFTLDFLSRFLSCGRDEGGAVAGCGPAGRGPV